MDTASIVDENNIMSSSGATAAATTTTAAAVAVTSALQDEVDDEESSDSVASVNDDDEEDEDDDDDEVDDDQMAIFAAHAAAQALSDNDRAAQEDVLSLTCRICGQGPEEGRAVLRFLAVPHDVITAAAAPGVTTFSEDVSLHIFCGKTATILPHVQRPDLEILTKAGIKNKHGIGPEVNAALARTRCATTAEPHSKEKQYYLVREFEAHLAAIRHTHLPFDLFQEEPHTQQAAAGAGEKNHHHHTTQQPTSSQTAGTGGASGSLPSTGSKDEDDNDHEHLNDENGPTDDASSVNEFSTPEDIAHVDAQLADFLTGDTTTTTITTTPPVPSSCSLSTSAIDYKIAPYKAASSLYTVKHKRKASSDSNQAGASAAGAAAGAAAVILADGKVRCGCGGTHWPASSSKGAQSWRSHVLTKRHQKWVEEQQLVNII